MNNPRPALPEAATTTAALRRGRIVKAASSLYDEVALLHARLGAVRLVRRLGLRPHDGLQRLVDAIAHKRGTRIVILEVPLPTEVSGLCVQGQHTDIILVDNRAATPLLRLTIKLHELRHLLNDTGSCAGRLRRRVSGLLERRHLRTPLPAARGLDPDHSVFSPDVLAGLLPGLPPAVVHEVLGTQRPVHTRAPHQHALDPAEVFARQVIQMLPLHEDVSGTGAITSSLNHRRTGL